MNEIFQEFERKFDTDSVRLSNRPVWPAIRVQVFFAMRASSHGEASIQKSYLFHLKKKIGGVFYGFHNLFRRSPYLFFSNTNEHKLIDGKWTNKLFIFLFKAIGSDKITYFERPVPEHCPITSNGNPHPVSSAFLQSLGVALSFVIKPKIEDGNLTEVLKNEYKVSFNAVSAMKLLAAYEILFTWFLKWKRPKAIFLSDSYALFHIGLISAAKSLSIKVIEHQHGIINFEHPAYNHYTSHRFDESFYPDFLLTFGPMVVKEIEPTSFIPKERIVSIGHPYLEYTYQRYEQSKKNNNEIVVGVTLQWTDEDRVIPFINEVAKRAPDIHFVLIPRIPNLPKYSTLLLPPNVVVEKNIDFYGLLKGYITIHCTTYSTCALESPFMGIPNVLIDFDNMATRYFGRILPATDNVFYVTKEDDFIAAVRSLKSYSKYEVRQEVNHLYAFDYQANLDKFLKKLK